MKVHTDRPLNQGAAGTAAAGAPAGWRPLIGKPTRGLLAATAVLIRTRRNSLSRLPRRRKATCASGAVMNPLDDALAALERVTGYRRSRPATATKPVALATRTAIPRCRSR